MTDAASIVLRSLSIRVDGRTLIRDVDAVFDAGRLTVVIGPSGGGKSVLLRTIADLHDPASPIETSGDVSVGGGGASGKIRPRIGVVFQSYAVLDEFSSADNVRLAIDHRPRRPDAEDPKPAAWWLEALAVPNLARPAVMSGGQRQRLAIARTMAGRPDVVLYDEPTSGLDPAAAARVADLIADTARRFGRTSVVVTHDIESWLSRADAVWLLDAGDATLRRLDDLEPDSVRRGMSIPAPAEPVGGRPSAGRRMVRRFNGVMEATGSAALAAARSPVDVFPLMPTSRWSGKMTWHYLRLAGGPSAAAYLSASGAIAGFVATFFVLRFLPMRIYTQPLLMDDLVAAIGFGLYRVLVPVLTTVLIAARTGAALAGDVGTRRYGGQIDALRTLGVRPTSMLMRPITLALLVTTPLWVWLAYHVAATVSMLTFSAMHPDIGPAFWSLHFDRRTAPSDTGWVVGKSLASAVGVAAIGYHVGMRPKPTAAAVGTGVTTAVLWSTLFVLLVHFAASLIEF